MRCMGAYRHTADVIAEFNTEFVCITEALNAAAYRRSCIKANSFAPQVSNPAIECDLTIKIMWHGR